MSGNCSTSYISKVDIPFIFNEIIGFLKIHPKFLVLFYCLNNGQHLFSAFWDKLFHESSHLMLTNSGGRSSLSNLTEGKRMQAEEVIALWQSVSRRTLTALVTWGETVRITRIHFSIAGILSVSSAPAWGSHHSVWDCHPDRLISSSSV